MIVVSATAFAFDVGGIVDVASSVLDDRGYGVRAVDGKSVAFVAPRVLLEGEVQGWVLPYVP